MKQPRGAAGADLLFFIFFLVVLGIVWALTGGPDRAISRSGPFLNPPFPLGNGSAYTVPGIEVPSVSSPERSTRRTVRNALDNVLTRIRSNFGAIQEGRSPHAGSVSLSVGRARETDPHREYVVLKTNKSLTGNVSISNWRIESSETLAGTELGNAAYLPYSGEVNTELPVTVPSGTTLYIVSGRSPIGASFRTNTCTGYFAQFQEFEPDLKEECPLPENELSHNTQAGFVPNGACLDFIEDIDRCTLTLTQIPPQVGGACQRFILEELTYSGCVTAHKDEPDFYKKEWRLYLDRDQELWQSSRERIRLLDENGLVIDVVSY